MSGEHGYWREVVVGVADPPHNGKALEDIRSSIAALAATVESLVAKQQEDQQPMYPHVDDEKLYHWGTMTRNRKIPCMLLVGLNPDVPVCRLRG